MRTTCSYRQSNGIPKTTAATERRWPAWEKGGPEGESSAWRDGTQQTYQKGQQQKTTQKQRELAHRNLFNVIAVMESIIGAELIRIQIQV
uniref:Uncharacterized protein n=1 Tax=Pseudomonas putida (strain W619) TaxID=390235 RepID=B1JAK4_PSEPW